MSYGARAGRGTGANKRAKDAAMAAYMKIHKIERHSANCPMCHKLVSLKSMDMHIIRPHGGRS